MKDNIWDDRERTSVLRMVSPGTPLREGLENVLKAKTGALIVLGDGDPMMKIVDGGFNINAEFSPAYLYELAKMDGGIVLSSDAKRILYANAQLIPSAEVHTSETGTRHRTAERVAKQTGEMVISISQRRNIITIYKGQNKYILQETAKILTKANQAIQTLEKYKAVLDQAMTNLSALEFEEMVTTYDAATVIQRMEMVLRIVTEVERYILELGNEGRLAKMQMEELIDNVKEDVILVFKDYAKEGISYDEFKKNLRSLTSEELLDINHILRVMGYSSNSQVALETIRHTKGYRILNKIPRLPGSIIEKLIKEFGNLQRIKKATLEDLDEVEGIGEIRAKTIKNGIRRIQEQSLLDRHI